MQVRPIIARTLANRIDGGYRPAVLALVASARPSVALADPMDPVVHLRGAVTLLGRFPALAGIDLDVAAGEIVLLRGPNGAGKTTLLRLLAGLQPPSRGAATVLGHDLTDRRQARGLRRRVGLLGHAAGLYDELTVADNVRFWGRAAGASPDDVDAALHACGLDGRLADLAVARLSAGQRRRTSLACLVARRPELWLLDEPHAGLDQEGRDVLDDLVRRAVTQGATVVLSSHELDRAGALAHRVVTIAGGTTDVASAPRISDEGAVLVP
jgi:heme ABC exporter ATP-binding subunit CcmA